MRRNCLVLLIALVATAVPGAQQAGAIAAPADASSGTDVRLRLATAQGDYPVTPGDRYTLSYFNAGSLVVTTVSVEGDYRLDLGVFGALDTADRTLPWLVAAVESRITAAYPDSLPALTLAAVGVFLTRVVGDPDGIRTVEAWGLSRLSDVLPDDLDERLSLRNIGIRDRNGALTYYDYYRAIRFDDASQDPYLHPGQTVLLQLARRTVTVGGEVVRPGRYELEQGEGLRELLDYAGGLTAAADPRRVRLLRAGGPRVEYLDMASDGLDAALRTGDQVAVPAALARLPAVVFEGAGLRRPGGTAGAATATPGDSRLVRSFVPGESLRDLLPEIAGELAPNADLERALLYRASGEVPISVDLRGLLLQPETENDVLLMAGDRFLVPGRDASVAVQGAVASPGVFPWQADRGATHYVSLAGGPVRERNATGEYQVTDRSGAPRPDGATIDVGDTIYVPTTSFVQRFNTYFPLISGSATLVVTMLTIVTLLLDVLGR